MTQSIEADKALDARGWSCAWCILKAKSELKSMNPGEVLEVRFTDPMTFVDFPCVVCQSGDELLHIEETSWFSRLYVRRGNVNNRKGALIINCSFHENHL